MNAIHRVVLAILVLATKQLADAHVHRDLGMVIVAPDAFVEALRPYAAARDRDLPTRLIALSDALKQGNNVNVGDGAMPAADDAERLKRFLFIEWRERRTRFALLAGDADVMPVRYMCLDRVTPEAFDYAFYPSDLYYADIAKPDGSFEDWNAQREGFHAGYFGEVRGEKNKTDPMNFDKIDYAPELAVGRWPISTIEEAKAVSAKSMRHIEARVRARAADDSHALSVAMIACGGWIENRGMMDEIATPLRDAGWTIERRYFSDNGHKSDTAPPDAENVIALANGGSELIMHSGHGNDDRWEHSISVGSIERMTGARASFPY